jgi:RND family efflux transporter MFP subunit
MRPPHSRAAGLFVLALALGAGGCKRNGGTPPPQQPPDVTVSRPVQREVTDYHDYTGRIEAVETVEVRARVKGYLQKIHFKEGAEVRKDDLLYEIDPRTFEADVERAKAQVAQSEAQLELARAEADRVTRLRGTGSISDEEYRQKLAARDTASAALQQARAALKSSELELSFTKIRAPIDGRISRTLVTEGNLVGFSEPTLLTTIVRLDPMYVYFDVPERNFLIYQDRIREEGVATAEQATIPVFVALTNESGYPHRGTIGFRDNRVDPGTGTITVRGELPNPSRLLTPGLFARVRVPLGSPKLRLLVPEVALAADQRGTYVLTVKDDDTVEYRSVKTGTNLDGLVVIEEGLKANDRVVVNGIQRARPGAKVRPREVKPGDVPKQAAPKDVRKPETPPANTPGSPGQPDIGPPKRPRD